MKCLVIGKGAIGGAIAERLGQEHEVIVASRSSKDYSVEIDDIASIKALFDKIGSVDHVINAAGKTDLVPFLAISDKQVTNSIQSKLVGQLNLVRVAQKYVKPGGSISLITGYLSHIPVPMVSLPALVNAAIERMVVNVALEAKDAFRINAYSPAMLKESVEKYGAGIFAEYPTVAGADVAEYVAKMLDGDETGKVHRIGWELKEEWK